MNIQLKIQNDHDYLNQNFAKEIFTIKNGQLEIPTRRRVSWQKGKKETSFM